MTRRGMNRVTGKVLEGLAHIRQSIADILTTPIGSRPMRRKYGSWLFKLIDMPLTGATRLLMSAATAEAVARWEPRVKLTRVTVTDPTSDGGAVLNLTGIRTDLPQPQPFSLSIAI